MTRNKNYLVGGILILIILFSFKSDRPNWVQDLSDRYQTEEQFVKYWYNSVAMKNYEQIKHIPQEVLISKMWNETHGGLRGAGRRGAIFGIKGSGIKGYDSIDGESVEYQNYNKAWKALSHFCDLINNEPELLKNGIDKIDNSLYYDRFLAWKELQPQNKDYENWLLALQVHPQLEKSNLSYAACGCKAKKSKFGNKRISKECYEKRRNHSLKCINWVKENLKE